MSEYELQILEPNKFYDEAITAAEQENLEVHSSVVPGSRLHHLIHNTIATPLHTANATLTAAYAKVADSDITGTIN